MRVHPERLHLPRRHAAGLAVVAAIIIVFGWLLLVSTPARKTKSVAPTLVEPGIPVDLAAMRVRQIQLLRYELSFAVPANINEPVRGHEVVRFVLRELPETLVLDFEQPRDHVV